MGKRSDFPRIERDYYPTIDPRAWSALKPHLPEKFTYAEPCYGEGHLAKMIEGDLVYSSDISDGVDALSLKAEDLCGADYIITNPPWSRKILHPLIDHLRQMRPTWLLFDASWAHTKQSSELIKYCSKIISVGRLRWIEGTTMTGKDDCCWYLFGKDKTETIFIGR